MAGGEGGEEQNILLEFTPTWIVAAVCSIIVLISLLVERFLHYLGKALKKKNQKPLFEALLKVKEELMLLGFISLLLTVFQGAIQKICIPEGWTKHMLPCKEALAEASTTKHFSSAFFTGVLSGGRRLLSESGFGEEHCKRQEKVPLLSLEAIHQLHIFIFVLAIAHVVFSVLTMLLGGAKIRQWKHWENSIQKETIGEAPRKVTHVHQFEFIRDHFKGFGKDSLIHGWLHSFVKQFYGSVTESDYTTMRLGFIMTHCRGNPKFDFHRYMMRAMEADFKKVVGISWYLWVFVVIFLLLNVNGWHTYFWIAFIPLLVSHVQACDGQALIYSNIVTGLFSLLLAIGTKLEHVITQLAHEVAEKHSAIEGDLIVKPSDDHFWLHRPRIVLYLIHFILFQNAFELAFFFWILATYGFNSCIMDHVCFIIPRLVIGVIIQLLCSYSTLPLYAIVTQMGSSFKKAIFDEHVQEGLVGWAQKIKRRKGTKMVNGHAGSSHSSAEPYVKIEMQKLVGLKEEGKSGDGGN